MFTGIIEEIGVIARRSGAELHIHAEIVSQDLHEGDSVAVNGVCLTVAGFNPHGFAVQVSPETFSRTTLGRLKPGDAVLVKGSRGMKLERFAERLRAAALQAIEGV